MCGLKFGLLFLVIIQMGVVSAESQSEVETAAQAGVDQLDKPLYSPFIERYILDDLKQLRSEMNQHRVEILQQVADREVSAVDKAVSYSTSTVTYFFYLIAGFSSLLVLVGWTSIRDIKAKVHSMATHEVEGLVKEYESRLGEIEQQLHQKSVSIDANREEIELTQEIHSLWLRASQEASHANKIPIYDQILVLRPLDCEALTYKADAALELNEPQWAINLCHKALRIDPDNAHAFYQLACAHASLGQLDEAVTFFQEALLRSESYIDEVEKDPALAALLDYRPFLDLLNSTQQVA